MGEIFVSPTGNDLANDGSEQRPFATITRAATELRPGDRLSLTTGTYYENALLEGLGEPGAAPIVISPADGHRVTIDGAMRDFIEHPELAWAPVQRLVTRARWATTRRRTCPAASTSHTRSCIKARIVARSRRAGRHTRG